MKTLSNHKLSRPTLARTFAVAAIVMIAFANGFDTRSARAAMRLPEGVLALEPWAVPLEGIPSVTDTAAIPEPPAPQDTLRRSVPGASLKVPAERLRRQSTTRPNKRALAELMGLVPAPGVERVFALPFEDLQNCRQFVAVNC